MSAPLWDMRNCGEHALFCREQAEAVLARAAGTGDPKTRENLLRLAASWQALAGELLRLKSEHPEIDAGANAEAIPTPREH